MRTLGEFSSSEACCVYKHKKKGENESSESTGKYFGFFPGQKAAT